MRIGIFGGSFSPVHAGHLKLASEALSELNLNRVYFVPSSQTPLKNNSWLLPPLKRVALLQKALKKNPAFLISLCEIKRKGISYTVDTLEFFKKKFGKKCTLYFLAGADTLGSFRRWRAPRRILSLARLAIFSRPGFPLKGLALPEGALVVPMDALAISSTQIRSQKRKP